MKTVLVRIDASTDDLERLRLCDPLACDVPEGDFTVYEAMWKGVVSIGKVEENPLSALQEVVDKVDALIADMERRALVRGDFETLDVPIPGAFDATTKKKIPVIDCGNSVLFGLDDALENAKSLLEKLD